MVEESVFSWFIFFLANIFVLLLFVRAAFKELEARKYDDDDWRGGSR